MPTNNRVQIIGYSGSTRDFVAELFARDSEHTDQLVVQEAFDVGEVPIQRKADVHRPHSAAATGPEVR